ncbi:MULTISPECIES: hypothetical protein [Lentibacillus]|uniref:Uncharacterized protein n=2 Tax=Lentibacillus TaxID=175304 RepID=A0A549YHN4_9BACI|nr:MULTISPECIES: hypothetical protein [Lentibacillus]TRM11396.1 hypothetical protein FH966_06630 [Lentibacillus cibarius]SFE50647.1 hypothetical protein SAMN05216238_12115 [Lentibacillus persicus]HLS08133.1 hypothetical protein [Lentibacillus sp.]
MWQGMKSVMVFDPKDSQVETDRKWREWMEHKSSVGDKYVPTAAETRKYLNELENRKQRYA